MPVKISLCIVWSVVLLTALVLFLCISDPCEYNSTAKRKRRTGLWSKLAWFTLLEVWKQTLTSMDLCCVSLEAYSVSGIYNTGRILSVYTFALVGKNNVRGI